MELEPDIARRVEEEFGDSSRSTIRNELGKLAAVPESQRVARCVLFLAAESEEKVFQFVAAALADYRDVIWWAEYDGKEERLRDFTQATAPAAPD